MTRSPATKGAHSCEKHAEPSYACYQGHSCRCDGCREFGRVQRKRQSYRLATKGPAYVDATPAREHLEWLLTSAVGLQATKARDWWFLPQAKEKGLGATQLRRIHSGETARVWPKTLDAVLSLSPEGYDAAGRMRDREALLGLLNALGDKGWTKHGVCVATGLASSTLSRHDSRKVSVATLAKLRALLAWPHPPAKYVTPPFGGWDAWWNARPDHPNRRHHTRSGCARRGCRYLECIEARRIYQRACSYGVEAAEPFVAEAVERHRLRERSARNTRDSRARRTVPGVSPVQQGTEAAA